jgi:hypothetical protein
VTKEELTTAQVQTVALVPGRLFIPATHGRTWRDASLPFVKRVSEVACSWQELSSIAWLWELGGAVGRAGRGRAHELAGLMAAGGEELALALSAAIEAELVRSHVASAGSDPAFEMSRRAFVDMQVLYVTGACHTLVNADRRALAFDQDLRRLLATNFAPSTEARVDRQTYNPHTAKLLESVAAASPHPEVQALVQPVADFGSTAMSSELLDRRGRDFHRWRIQSAGLSRVEPRDPWTKLDNGGWTIRIVAGSDRTAHDDAATAGSRIATATMTELAETMEKFLDGFVEASGLLGGPQFASGHGMQTVSIGRGKADPLEGKEV